METTKKEKTNVKELKRLIVWLKSKIVSLGMDESVLDEKWKNDEEKVAVNFFSDPESKVLYLLLEKRKDGTNHLYVQNQELFSGKVPKLFLYFIKQDFNGVIKVENVNELIFFGSIKENQVLDSLLEIVEGKFAPVLLSNQEWPERIKKDFASQIHKFLGSLTETAFRVKGTTMLYIPNEKITNVTKARKEKDLVSRLESVLIKWTSQIKEVVQEKDSMEDDENARPLSEIEYWKSRTKDLKMLKNQINSVKVQTILDVLKHSSYIQSFNKLSSEIQLVHENAKDNLKFLMTLRDSLMKLSKATPKLIPKIVPGILKQITLIWNLSKNYHTSERISGLLRKVSKEIIFRCKESINEDDIFGGDITKGIKDLLESIKAGKRWKIICDRHFKYLKAHFDQLPNRRKFSYDRGSVFAEIDAFVHRCNDLIEVCEAQFQLGNKSILPKFGGSRALEMNNSLNDIRAQFGKLLNVLKELDYSKLDVKSTAWHDDYGKFKNGVRDLELIMDNVLTSAFDSVRTIKDGVELLEGFSALAKREDLKNVIKLKTNDLLSFFAKEMDKIQSIFEKYNQNPPIKSHHPQYAGAAFWAFGLKQRIDRETKLVEKAIFLKEKFQKENRSRNTYVGNMIVRYINDLFEEWRKSVVIDDLKEMENSPLLRRTKEGFLEVNFSELLLSTYKECKYWPKFPGFELPTLLAEFVGNVVQKEGKLRVDMENINLVVCHYNEIKKSLVNDDDNEENMNHMLFKDRVRLLDQKINLGLKNIFWNNQKGIKSYVHESVSTCVAIKKEIDMYEELRYKVIQKCKEIEETVLIDIDTKKVYSERNFVETQRLHRKKVTGVLTRINNEMMKMVKRMFDIFKDDPEEIHEYWWGFVKTIEKKIDYSLRKCLKLSFSALSDAINGDKRITDTRSPLFFVSVELSESESTDKKTPVLIPSVEDLERLIESTQRELTKCVQVVVCLEPSLLEMINIESKESEFGVITEEEKTKLLRKKTLPNYSESIKNDKSFGDPMVNAYKGIKRVCDDVKDHLNEVWTKQFERLWRADRDVVTKRLMYKNKPSNIFEQEYQKYSFYLASVKKKSNSKVIGYLQLDFSNLKAQIAEEAETMMKTVLDVLHSQAKKNLEYSYDKMEMNTKLLKEPIPDREMLRKKLELLGKCKEEVYREGDEKMKEGEVNTNLSLLEKSFEPIKSHYLVLRKYLSKRYEKKVVLHEEEINMLENLEKVGKEYESTVVKTEIRLLSLKEDFKIKLRMQISQYEKQIFSMNQLVVSKGPIDSNLTIEKALGDVEEFKRKLAFRQKQMKKLRVGAKIFQIQIKNYKEIKEIQKNISLYERVWCLRKDWESTWKLWQTFVFGEIDIEKMKSTTKELISRLNILGKSCEEWGIWKFLQANLYKFKNTLPLIMDLKNPAMRHTHWEDLYEIIPSKFDYRSKDFNLKKIIEMNFESYSDDIRVISNAARQELNIENGLNKITNNWNRFEIEIVQYKDKYFKAIEMEEIFQHLDDDSAIIGVMKLNPFVTRFLSETNEWEKTLSTISEVLEILMKLQENWMYLLNIFEVDDISKQLPTETAAFRVINSRFRSTLEQMKENKTVLKACIKPDLANDLNDMKRELESIQKQLDDYLEIKRTEFPRFYFLADRDLLEILGQSKNPKAVQRHLQNCFAGTHSLKIEEVIDSKKGTLYFAKGLVSKEGEILPLLKTVQLIGRVEKWLLEIEKSMRFSVKKLLRNTYQELVSRRDKATWIKNGAGQLIILSSQLYWTKRVEEVLRKMSVGKGKRSSLKDLSRKTWEGFLKKYSKLIRMKLDPITREKLIALITVEVHNKDVIDNLIKVGCNSPSNFEWEKQLRFYFTEDHSTSIKQTSAEIMYDYEYIGPSSRLVITPLTERCYMTLTTAVHLSRGGNPKGPAGTGKTETVKDLSKTLGKLCIVFNCSRGLDINSMARMFSGLVQTGAWSCFDEFNRIEIEVLSVVAQQIGKIIEALIAKLKSFHFEGTEIKISEACGIFCTMNPGYAGRTDLPDNLKALLRPISMMRPDSSLICEIFLYAQGFNDNRTLSKKIVTLYDLMKMQLSQQKHYDFGLRAIKSVLTAAGNLKRTKGDKVDEQVMLLQACRDMNFPKFIADDIPLFNNLLKDIFPGVELAETKLEMIEKFMTKCLYIDDLQSHKNIILKAIQLYETKKQRHGVMVVGKTCSGKSITWQYLIKALNIMKKNKVEGISAAEYFIINPKALNNEELYGFYTKSRDWRNGVLSIIMKNACKDSSDDEKWIVFDGPVDTLWIESMNSLLDDTKTLTLISGERIQLSEKVSLLFEVSDLASASPATVSRCGMIFFDETKLHWELVYRTLCKQYVKDIEENDRKKMEQLYLSTFHTFVKRSFLLLKDCTELVKTNEIQMVKSLFNLFESLDFADYGVELKNIDHHVTITKLFIFSMIWTIGATVVEKDRKKMDMLFREFDTNFPSKKTVYEYFLDEKSKSWRLWEERIPKNWQPPTSNYYNMMVPTVDTTRNMYVIRTLLKNQKSVMVVGDVGTGKTSIVKNIMGYLDEKTYSYHTINFSARTSSKKLQQIIESKVEKKSFDIYAPISGKRLVVFVDDFNMPMKDQYGSQPPLELVRQFIDYEFWYDRTNQAVRKIQNVQLVTSMGPPGGGREEISPRVQSRFNIINITFPKDSELHRIYSTLLRHRLDRLEDLKSLIDKVINSTIGVYKFVTSKFRPTPNKSHYIFNLRDLSKVFLGMLSADHESMDTSQQLQKLWVHENYRVFYDRLADTADRNLFEEQIKSKLLSSFGSKWTSLFYKRKTIVPFGTVLGDTFHEMNDEEKLIRQINHQLFCYNNEIGVKPMKLILFSEAIDHICRISRIINQPKGNALLIGVGGSGRSSLTRMAAYISHFDVFEIEISNNYVLRDFRESLKDLYRKCGLQSKDVVFLIKDTQLVEDYFLEDINNMLNSGEVPNLFEDDEIEDIFGMCRVEAMKHGCDDVVFQVYEYFLETCKKHMHIVVCMSPVGNDFRRRIRMFPSLVSCTTIDWFDEWPDSALKEVAKSFLKDVNFEGVELTSNQDPSLKIGQEEDVDMKKEEFDVRDNISEVFVRVHNSVRQMSDIMLSELKRQNYVTPTNYLELVMGYIDLLEEKEKSIGRECKKLEQGVLSLDNARDSVLEMSVDLAKQKEDVALAGQECENLMKKIMNEQKELSSKKELVNTKRMQIEVRKKKLEKIEAEALRELEKVQPELERAKALVNEIDANDIMELRGYSTTPKNVEMVLCAVMIVLGKKPTYEEAKIQMAKPSKFIKMILNFNHKTMTNKLLAKIKKITSQPKFKPKVVLRSSAAVADLCAWVIASENYGKCWKKVKPTKDRLESARTSLSEEIEKLNEAEKKLNEFNLNLKVLEKQFQDKKDEKKAITKMKENTQKKLFLATELVNGLKDEKERWTQKIGDFKIQIKNLPGDVLLASAFLSYVGPFTSTYREKLKKMWLKMVKDERIPFSPKFEPKNFLINPVDIQSWIIQGLPSDSFSGENGSLVTRGRRFPLMIDPQGQANKWIRNLEKDRGLEVTDFKKDNFLRNLENAIVYGRPVLIQDVLEDIDPSLYSVIGKDIYKKGNRKLIKLGDKELDFNPGFRLYMTTKMSNPHYKPEICTRTTIVNFSVTKSGLEEQLLVTVVKKERPDLETRKNSIVMNVANDKKTMVKLENSILQQITTSKSLLSEEIIDTLKESKRNSEKLKKQLLDNEENEKNIDNSRNLYKKAAVRASILYFVLCDLSIVDPMYQFSLEKYIELFENSIENSEVPVRKEDVDERVLKLNNYHTLSVYNSTCQGLFERDKLLFSFHLCAQIELERGKLDQREYNFFLRGGAVMDKEPQMVNPCSEWLPEKCWDSFFELNKLVHFHEITNSLEESSDEWYEWYRSSTPETHPLPSSWQSKCGYWERMLLVRCCREDRLILMIREFVVLRMSSQAFIKSPTTKLSKIYKGSNPLAPFIFILSSGVDPLPKIEKLAKEKKITLNSLSLGQNQERKATQMILKSLGMGEWVFLANCHLMMSWMPSLSKLIEDLSSQDAYVDPNFRLFLSSKPHKKFPISILQKSRKITMEPSSGIQNNMVRLLNEVSERKYDSLYPMSLKKVIFSLLFYHSVLLERSKFGSLGWNKSYDFNDSDFQISRDILKLYFLKKASSLNDVKSESGSMIDDKSVVNVDVKKVEKKKEDLESLVINTDSINWNAIRFLIGEISYGGRVTDEHDQLVLNIYTKTAFNKLVIEEPLHKLTNDQKFYRLPRTNQMEKLENLIMHISNDFPTSDQPIAFGQHFNADISSQIQNSNRLLKDLVSINPISVGGSALSTQVDQIPLLSKSDEIPDEISLELAKHGKSALYTILVQESNRYNGLIKIILKTLVNLGRALKGDIVMDRKLEKIFNELLEGKVPEYWNNVYRSEKNLSNWIRDLQKRIRQLKRWAEGDPAKIFWLSGFIFPSGFLTAVKQVYARQKNVSVEFVHFEFIIIGAENLVTSKPKEGIYVNGLFLEGAGWDEEENCLCEPSPMKLLTPMPVIWFKPYIQRGKKKRKVKEYDEIHHTFSCPVYYYPQRGRESFVCHVDLKLGGELQEEWAIKRGTALLLSTS